MNQRILYAICAICLTAILIALIYLVNTPHAVKRGLYEQLQRRCLHIHDEEKYNDCLIEIAQMIKDDEVFK